MPLYIFKSRDGQTIERVAPRGTEVWAEDGKAFTRDVVAGFGVPTGAVNPDSQEEQIRKGYSALENKLGSRWKSNYSKNAIKAIWGI